MEPDFDLVKALETRSFDLLTGFFGLLWSRANVSGVQRELSGVVIPDTIVLHHSRPIHWYFTNKDGHIRMKARRNLTTEAILEHLRRRKARSVSGACSQFVRHVETEHDGVAVSFQRPEDLASFVSANQKVGVLQQYVDPKGDRATLSNSEIVACWTPNVVYMERRLNDAKLAPQSHSVHLSGMPSDAKADAAELRADLGDRCTASETCRFVRTAPVVSAHTLTAVEKAALAIADHISAVFRVQVTSLTLHCKVDASDRVVVLRCSGLRAIDPRTRAGGSAVLELHSVASATPSRSRQLASTKRGGQDELMSHDGATVRSGGLTSSHAATSATGPGGKPRTCVLCNTTESGAADGDGRAPMGMCRIARRHVLFPLSVMQFFADDGADGAHQHSTTRRGSASTQPPGSPSAAELTTPSRAPPTARTAVFNGAEAEASWTEADGVPAHVKLIAPELRPSDYAALRNDAGWLDERVSLCEGCAASIHAVAAAIHIDDDGNIRRPEGSTSARGKPPAVAFAPKSRPRRQRDPAAVDGARTPAKQRPAKAADAAGTPTPAAREPPSARTPSPYTKPAKTAVPRLPPIAKTPTPQRAKPAAKR